MNSHPTQDAILAELGDKVMVAIAVSVSAAHDDLVTYREQHAGWVADHSERGLANWIHDRVWSHLMHQLDGEAEITVVDHEPMRVVRVGMKYLMRVKRHGLDDKISTYPTQTALQFYMQGQQPLFPEMGEVRLAAGYLSLESGDSLDWRCRDLPAGWGGQHRVERRDRLGAEHRCCCDPADAHRADSACHRCRQRPPGSG